MCAAYDNPHKQTIFLKMSFYVNVTHILTWENTAVNYQFTNYGILLQFNISNQVMNISILQVHK